MVVLISHLGRPKGERESALSLSPVAVRLGELLGCEVAMADDCVGDEVERRVVVLGSGQVLLLENLRFHAVEEQNDPDFSRQLVVLGDIYVNDVFGAAYRAYASTVGVMRFIGTALSGFLLERELAYFDGVL